MPSLSELWKVSGVYYRHLGFLTYMESRAVALKEKSVERLAKSGIKSLLYNKVFLSLIFFASSLYAAMGNSVISFASYLLLLIFMFSFFFLQVVTYFFQLNFDLLRTLPLSERDVRKIMLLTFVRIFDIPLGVNIISFPVAISFFNGLLAFFPAFFGVLIAEIFSITIVTFLSKIFYTKLSQPVGGWKGVIRILYQVIWGATFFLFYAAMMWMRRWFMNLSSYQPLMDRYAFIFKLFFPFNFSYLMVAPDILSLTTSLLFILLGYYALRWTLRNIGRMSELHVEESPVPEKIKMKFSGPIYGIIRKDLKLISRNPGLLMLALLPAFESILLMALGNPVSSSIYIIFTFVIILIYSLFGIEKLTILRILPMPKGKVYLSKNIIGLISFLISLLIVDSYLLLRNAVPDLVTQIILIPAMFSAGIICLYLGDKLGVKKSVGLSAIGFVLIIALGNIILLLPQLAASLMKDFMNPMVTALLISLVELFVGVEIIRRVR